MAKPLGPKSVLIREAITANPDVGNTGIAEMLNDAPERMDDKIKVSAQEVASQRQAMKKSGGPEKKPAGNKGGRRAAAPPVSEVAAVEDRPAAASPVDLIERTLDLAQQCGGLDKLKQLVDRMVELRG